MRNKGREKEFSLKGTVIICVVVAVALLASFIFFVIYKDINAGKKEDFGTVVMEITDQNGDIDTVVLDNIIENSPFIPVDTVPLETSKPPVEAAPKEDGVFSEVSVGQGLTVVSVAPYSGEFIEDGSDTAVNNIISAVIRNDGEKDIQYAEVYFTVNSKFAKFTVTTLPVGASVMVLEETKMAYVPDAAIEYSKVSNVAYFMDGMSMHSDVFSVTGRNGYMNLSNKTETDIDSDVVVYYKRVKDGIYHGGITYSVRAKGGVKAQSSTLLASPHFSLDDCKVLFITYEK